jgi:hypothetical protein
MSYGVNPYRRQRNFDISVSPSTTYAGELQAQIMSAAVSSGDTLANGWVHQIDGIHHKGVISTLNAADTIVAGSCTFNDQGNLTLGEKVITLSDLKVNEEICRGTVYPTWQGAATGRVNTNLMTTELQNEIVAQVAAKTAEHLETIIWQGSSMMPGFLSNDGTALSEADLDASVLGGCVEYDIANTIDNADIDNYLGGVYAAAAQNCPAILAKPDIEFLVSPKTYAFYLQYLAGVGTGQGYLQQSSNQGFAGVTYLGVPVRRCPGMHDDCIILTYADNLKVGTNLGTDLATVEFIPVYQYDGSDNVRVVMRMEVGVQCVTPGDAVVGATVWT